MQDKLSGLFRDNNRIAVVIFVLIILAPFGYSLVRPVFTQGSPASQVNRRPRSGRSENPQD